MVANRLPPPPMTIRASAGMRRVQGQPRIMIWIENAPPAPDGSGEMWVVDARRFANDILTLCAAASGEEAP